MAAMLDPRRVRANEIDWTLYAVAAQSEGRYQECSRFKAGREMRQQLIIVGFLSGQSAAVANFGSVASRVIGSGDGSRFCVGLAARKL